MRHGFVRVAAAIPRVRVADCEYNRQEIESFIDKADKQNVEIVVFPELAITSYTCQDLFHQQRLIEAAEREIANLADFTVGKEIIVVVGAPVACGPLLLNCGVVIQNGKILAVVPKTFLPNYREFYEKRWFSSALDVRPATMSYAGQPVTITGRPQIMQIGERCRFGIEICEDLWAPTPPSNTLALEGADIILNLSASDELIGKHEYLKTLIAQQSARTITGYVYSGCGFGESTQDVVYGGNAMIYEDGCLLAEADRFSFDPQMMIADIDVEKLRSERRTNSTFVSAQTLLDKGMASSNFNTDNNDTKIIVCCAEKSHFADNSLMRYVNPDPFIPASDMMKASCEEIFNIQTAGLAKRLTHIRCKTAVVGISGGLDSTLALLVCVKTFDKLGYDRKGIIGITMPGFGTTDRTYNNAMSMMQTLGITVREIPIRDAVIQHFKDIGHDISNHDVTYENSQARERTQILMDVANQVNGIVIGTGDLSELALGWATYNGDHMSMYGVNASVPKTLIKYLVRYVADNETSDAQTRSTLLDVLDTPISPELIPADKDGNIKQKTEDLVGPYQLHDFFLYYFMRYGFRPEKIRMLAVHAFIKQQETPLYSEETIDKWLNTFLRRFFTQQFKRSCLPDGPKVGSVSLSPRGDLRMPTDASYAAFL
ncbi:MAG: NAD(+) synthase [Prevotella sp.]|nr:NAD(+) synthase [Prevotella sp.]